VLISTGVEDLVESITRGNPTEVKVVLASVVLALACYQLVLIAVGYGKVRTGWLAFCRCSVSASSCCSGSPG
jgi:hypothetical protein